MGGNLCSQVAKTPAESIIPKNADGRMDEISLRMDLRSVWVFLC